jgi:quinol monooxygenase YgiN
MIRITAKQTVKEGKLEEFLPIAQKLVEETKKNAAGCIRYELFQDVSDPQIVTMFEEWEDQASIDKHMKAQHFLDGAPKLGELCSKPVELNVYKKLF